MEELLDAYCQTHSSQWDVKRVVHHKNVMDRFLSLFPYVRDITHETLGNYVEVRKSPTRRGTLRSNGTINRELSELRSILI